MAISLQDEEELEEVPGDEQQHPGQFPESQSLYSQAEEARRADEDQALRQLRMLLRVIVEKVILDRRFRAFSAPVSEEDHPEYYNKVFQKQSFAKIEIYTK